MDGVDLDLLAASLRADAGDVGAFVEGLAAKLEDVLPGRASVQRARSGMFGPKQVRSIAIEVGERRLELRRGGGETIETSRSLTSGGIVLKRERLEIDEWLRALGEAIGAEAQRSEHTRRALERLLIS